MEDSLGFGGILTVLLVILSTLWFWKRRKRSSNTPWFKIKFENGGPQSARWLASHWSSNRKIIPHVFKSSASPTGLRPLKVQDWIEIEDRKTFAPQIQLKRNLLTNPDTSSRFYASIGPNALQAESEVLQILLDHLERHFGDDFTLTRDSSGKVVTVQECITMEVFQIIDFENCPLKLCGLLVQEDFILLNPDKYQFVAGCAAYSFMEIGLQGEKSHMDLNNDVEAIHTPVPGFNGPHGIWSKVKRFFRNLNPDSPQYRTNWILVSERGLNPLYYNLSEDTERESGVYLNVNDAQPNDLNLRVECQSIRRLPNSQHILFTIHTYSDPLPTLEKAPKAAAVLRKALLDLDGPRCRYRGMDEATVKKVASYLEKFAGKFI